MSSYNILWVEDDADQLADMMDPLLEEGYNIDIAYNYATAKKKIASNSYDLIILDIIIPSGINKIQSFDQIIKIKGTRYGMELLKIIDKNIKIPVIVFSVVTDPLEIERIKKFNVVVEICMKGHLLPSILKELVVNNISKKTIAD